MTPISLIIKFCQLLNSEKCHFFRFFANFSLSCYISRLMRAKFENIRPFSRLTTGCLVFLSLILLSGCASMKQDAPASMAIRRGAITNPDAVKVRVSLANRAVYVYEGDEPRFITSVEIGRSGYATPTGDTKAFNKIARKRSNTYGFFVKGDQIIPGKRSQLPPGYRYVGYPMPWWVEFAAGGYGFHAGAVWPEPRSHGCLHIHSSVAGDFFHMVKEGTPIHVAHSLPEDATIGKNIPRPHDYNHPDSPPSVLITDAPFSNRGGVYF